MPQQTVMSQPGFLDVKRNIKKPELLDMKWTMKKPELLDMKWTIKLHRLLDVKRTITRIIRNGVQSTRIYLEFCETRSVY